MQGETVFLRIDQLAGLGCCCFCSIQFILLERTLQSPELIRGFLNATQRGAAFTTEQPDAAYELICQARPQLRTPMYRAIFMRTLPFFSRSLLNRDWNKVGRYTRHLGIIDEKFDINAYYTNHFIPEKPHSDIESIACCLSQSS